MEPLTKKQGMMKKLFVICSWALLLGGCKANPGLRTRMETNLFPPRPNCCKRSKTWNAGLVSLKTLAGAVSQSGAVAGRDGGRRAPYVLRRDRSDGSLQCGGGSAADRHCGRWGCVLLDTRRGKDIPWLKDAAGAKMPVSGPVPVVGRDDKGFWTVTTDAAVTPWQIEDGSGNRSKPRATSRWSCFGR